MNFPQSVEPRIPYESCPLCGHEDAVDVGTWDCTHHALYKPGLPPTMRWIQCEACEHVFVDGYFGQRSLDLLFGHAHPNQTPGNGILETRRVASKIIEDVTSVRGALGGSWLDVGVGSGALLTTAEEFGFDVAGTDLRPETARKLRAYGYDVSCVELSALAGGRRFDVVSMADVLEHMPFPKRALEEVHALLEEHGLLFLSMPNTDAFAFRALALEGNNPYFAEIEHLHNFGRKRLYGLLDSCGFVPCRYGISQRYVACMEVIARKKAPVA